jgi:hypothetical protein
MFIGPALANKPAVKQHAQADQEHAHTQLIDKVHGAQVEIRLTVRVVLAEEIPKGGAEIEKVFTVHDEGR